MNLLDKISAGIIRTIGEFSNSEPLCLFITGFVSVLCIICIRGLVSGLFEMHRSRSAQKKLYKEYSFLQKVVLKHAWQACLHAKRFCRFLIIYHHVIAIAFFLELLLALFSVFFPGLAHFIAYFTLISSVCFFTPVCILNTCLDRYPFIKFKHEFTFRKYHNTQDHNSLW